MSNISKIFLFLFLLTTCQIVFAHGTLEIPISRIFNCYKENPENPQSDACKAAVQVGGTQALYDWNGINQAAANDRHREIIPDGKLCSAGRDLFKGMDLARTDWVTTSIMPKSNGTFDFVWRATAPHATKYFRFYITKPTYDFNQPLKWSDLEDQPFCTITNVVLENGTYKMNCPFPTGGGKRIIYIIWQRSDSMEAFYACSDVSLSDGPPPPSASWNILGDFYAHADVATNTKIVFRIFKDTSEIGTYSIVANAANNKMDQWPYYLATEVNAKSTFVHIGQLTQNGQVVPVMSSSLNKVYIQDSNLAHYHFVVDFYPVSDQYEYLYPDNIEKYTAGTIVLGRDQKRYQCKPWPASGWCSQSPAYYEPGFGLAWQDAWNLLS